MKKKLLASTLGLAVLFGGVATTSSYASTSLETGKANFEGANEVSAVEPEAVPALAPLAVAGAKVVGGSALAGFGAAAGAWAFNKVTGVWSYEPSDVSYEEVSVVFDKQ